ncbi:alpha/beta hydrolase [Myroides odoratimimus]|uniref:alpha/beta hydrolase n=1 Tax=Myroides odoratimimus TaxID=76832 RepID=UPI0025791E65|nr:alpha/beta fold hydrolase [Myroides odoratimimus]MDM1453313.1 alpha/beta hydrolase [Myroides odoratimimus]MDM1477019.1 alpha/beta hydrolase [Myroides odoratimimus]MDM1488660.1 alpha/beta hydrolase [Myroides odoratimimus]MDM1524849.1 alpha/beta hydrolase [Myroides odoratimimus]MEC4043194.1 alpha/beta fold hydrolase [Myroides odoratimimus]
MKKLLTTLTLCFATSFSFAQTAVQVDSEIDGDLYLANKDSKQLAIIIAGSGPTNKNGNNPAGVNANSYKYLAQGLKENGINTFTYNKRMFAQIKNQTINEADIKFEDNVSDLNIVIDYFKKDYPNIILIGHSEGAMVATLASQDNSAVSKLISLQGPGESVDKILYKQITAQAPFFAKSIEDIHAKLRKGEIVDSIPPMLQSLYRTSAQPYLMSWMKYDPTVELKKVKQPILILQGDKDLQVKTDQGDNLKQAVPTATLVTIKGMNHVLKTVVKEDENLALYTKPDVPLHTELVPTIVNFIKK